MFTIQVWFHRSWKWGVNQYDTIESAKRRVQELTKVGIKARVRPSSELYGG